MIILTEKYTPENYPKYDNYDAIEVSKVADIPKDYDGVMGVPITFLDKYNPEQFEIIGTSTAGMPKGAPYVNGKRIYERILIRRCHQSIPYSAKENPIMRAAESEKN